MTLVGETQVSPRRKEPIYQLSTGETVVVTKRPDIDLPDDVDGVLRKLENGSFKWSSHRRVKAFEELVTKEGWSTAAEKNSDNWSGEFSFRSEQSGAGQGDPEGLRPPQLGALHSIGAHWSLFHQPATVVMPTGTGKTETMLSVLASYQTGPLLVIVPSDALRTQTARKFLTFGLLRKLKVLSPTASNPIVGIITKRPRTKDDLDIFDSCNVIVATMSALGEGDALPLSTEIAKRVGALMVDEAHHIGADGWARFREAFLEKRVLQFTATPFRRDGKLVDGEVIYNYPLRMAQQDGYFKKIVFEPVYEIDPAEADRAIAETALTKLRADIDKGLNHALMARCANIDRATAIHQIYMKIAPDLHPMLVHSGLTDTDERVERLRSGNSRIAVCVNMLGEGFNLPELKVAAVHDLHKSLAVLLQFVGRFTRSAAQRLILVMQLWSQTLRTQMYH
jgi:superfamily II DNA or RNA helicase